MALQHRPRDRWLALLLLLATLSLVYLVVIHPFFTVPWRALGDEIATLQERQHRVQVQIDQRPQVSARLQEVTNALRLRPGFLPEETAEAAAAALSSRVQDVVLAASPGNSSCVVSNRTPMPDNRAASAYARVALQVRLRCGVDETAAVLHALETGTPRLFVENLNMLAQRFQQSPDETGTGLDVSFELVGYLQPESMSASRTPGEGVAAPAPGAEVGTAESAQPAAHATAAEPSAGEPEPPDVEGTDEH